MMMNETDHGVVECGQNSIAKSGRMMTSNERTKHLSFVSIQTMIRNLIFLLLVAEGAAAQSSNRGVTLVHYALDSFTAGTVLLKNGTSSQQLLNYNAITGEMIFGSGDKYLALAHPQDVDTAFIGGRRFVPVADKFCEWLGGTQPALFKEYRCIIKEPGVDVGFGKSSTTASTALSSFIRAGGAYGLKLPDEFEVVPSVKYFLRSKGKFYAFGNAQEAAKSLPAKKSAIEDWLKTHPSKFATDEERLQFVKALQE